MSQTLYDKIWTRHLVKDETYDVPALLYVDRHLIHESTSPQAFDELRRRNVRVRRPDLTFATADHVIPTSGSHNGRRLPYVDERSARQVVELQRNAVEQGITYCAPGEDGHGIVHVTGPECGLSLPGTVIVCGDSHTSTHGAFGALAFGIGTTEVGHVLATQTLLQRKSRNRRVQISGWLPRGVSAKDMTLAFIRRVGVAWGRDAVIEYSGPCVSSSNMDERMTLCNMSIEAGARAGLVAPDDTTFEYLAGRRFAPSGRAWDEALRDWRGLGSDAEASFDETVTLDATQMAPMITYGTNPSMAMPIDEAIPHDADAGALRYMQLSPGERLLGKPIDMIFIGSCTNSRLSDLRAAAHLLRGRRVAEGVRAIIVPGSRRIKLEAEREGLAEVFLQSGAEWREPGCSMCIALNGDAGGSGQLVVSTSNRNFEGRQGRGCRTLLASPATAAAAALTGRVTDPRTLSGAAA